MVKMIKEYFEDHVSVINKTLTSNLNAIEKAAKLMSDVLNNNGTIFWCGNGGSAADCQHLAAELVGRFKKDRVPLNSLSLTVDSSVLTCISNDYSYDDIFSRQVEALGRKGDLLVGISTSGNSENVCKAIEVAKNKSLKTLVLTGSTGKLKMLSDQAIQIPSNDTARIQETHILIGHILCALIEKNLNLS